MATREGIREGIESIIQKFEADSPDAGYGYEREEMAQEILKKLHSQGVKLPNGESLLEVDNAERKHKEPL